MTTQTKPQYMSRYPVWDAVVEWYRCERQLVVPSIHKHQGNQNRIIINLDALKSSLCEWIHNCPDMKDLRYFLAKFLQERYWKKISDTLGVCIPAPSDGQLDNDNIANLLGCVAKWDGADSPGRIFRDDGHLSLHNCIRITHPEIAGQVRLAVPVCFSPVNCARSHTHNTTHAAVMCNLGVT